MNFQADLFTGRFSYSLPIKVAPARQGAEPTLGLGYNSSAGNGWCGVGWGLDVGYIQRDLRKGVPVKWALPATSPLNEYDDDKGYIANFGGAGSKLVLVGATNQNPLIYRQEVETAFLTYKYYTNNHWEVVDKSGNTFYFGEGNTNRMENSKSGWTAGAGKSTFRWALNKVVDVNGNLTLLRYTTDSGMLYLTNISYNGNVNSPTITPTHTVDFVLTNRTDTNITFQSAYRVEVRKLLSEIQIKADGNQVRKYVLGYTNSPSTTRTLLASMTEYGSDFATALPPLAFGYQVKPFSFAAETNWPSGAITNTGYNSCRAPGPPQSEPWTTNQSDWNYVGVTENPNTYVQIADADGDGLPDWIHSFPGTNNTRYFSIGCNNGAGFQLSTNRIACTFSNYGGATDWSDISDVDVYGATYVDFLDINGDGYTDRVMRRSPSPYTNFFAELNNGDMTFGGLVKWGNVTNESSASEWRSIRYLSFVKLVDMNGDGLPDRVARKLNSPRDRFKVQFNTGTNFADTVDWVGVDAEAATYVEPGTWASMQSDWNTPARTIDGVTSVNLQDVNGDGLPDRVMRKYQSPFNKFVVQFNNGAGFEPWEFWGELDSQGQSDADWNSPIRTVTDSDGGGSTTAAFFDINGDGLPDRVMRKFSAPYTNWVVQLNTGCGLTAAINWSGLSSGEQTNKSWNGISAHWLTTCDQGSATYVDTLDINGDGLPDRVLRKPGAINGSNPTNFVVQLNQGPFPDLLNVVSNGIGGSALVTYAASTTLDNRHTNWVSDPWKEGAKSLLSFNQWVVSQIVANDGMGISATNTYTFRGGFFEPKSREFRGFSRAQVTDPLGAISVTYFHQGGGRDEGALGEYLDQSAIAKKGIPFRVEVVGSDGATNKITLNKVEEVQLHTNGWYFPFLSQTIVLNYEGLSTYRATAKQLQYDTNTGNLLKDISLAEVTSVDFAAHTFTDVISADNLYTHTTYALLSNPDLLDKPASVKITTDSAGSNRLRETQLQYEGPRGNLTNTLVWLDTAASFISTGTASYDHYGNPTNSISATGISTTTTYDSTYQQFPLKQVTASFTNQFVYDLRSGQTIMAIDPKGLVASNYFDVFYRPRESYISTNAFGSPTLWQQKQDYNLGGIASGISYNYVRKRVNDAVDTVNGHESYVYADGQGRAIQNRIEAENGQFRVSDTVYNRRGAAYFQTLPYFSSGSGHSRSVSCTNLGTLSEFDSLGRAFRSTPAVQGMFDAAGHLASTNATGGDSGSPVGPVTTAFIDGSNPWASVVTDSENKVKKSFSDAYGRVTNITEVTSGGSYLTTYVYDLLGNLTNLTDHAGNQTRMVYDSLGRKTSIVDPDMGTWSYTYDNAGQMTQQIDARTNKIMLHFDDPLGRLTRKEIYNGANQLVSTVTNVYDISDDPAYTIFKGQLYKVTDSEGTQRASYDVRGRVLKSARQLRINSMEYVTQTTYDEADRPVQVVYPNNAATIKYTYDTAGNLIQVKSLAGTGTQEIFYTPVTINELGQVTSYTNGAGTLTTNLFFANSKRLQEVKASTGGTNHQHLAYTYDKASNLKSIGDNVYTGSASAGLSSLVYDDLHRLISLSSVARGAKTYSYDAIGNTLVNQDFGTSTYQYGSKPHAVTNANSKSYTYDACGNMVARGSQMLVYDEQNHLVRVSQGNTNVVFGYAEGGGRLWRAGTNGYSVWIGSIYEINNGKVLCHVFAGGMRVASFEPQCGGLWSRAIGEERWVAVTGTIASVLNWPFQEGRTPFTTLIISFGFMLAICLAAQWHLGRVVSERGFRHLAQMRIRPRPVWQQLVTFVSLSALILATTPTNVEAQTYNPVFYYYHSDHLGSSNVMTDRAGWMVQHYEHGTWGKESYRHNVSAYSVSNRYTGQVLDDETGLYYYNARYYDPELGRFTQPDTIVPEPGDPQTLNRYAYCGNNPINYVDPSGHWIEAAIIGLVIGAAIGGVTAAITGGDIGLGILSGALSGFLVGAGIGLGGTYAKSYGMVGAASKPFTTLGGALGGAAGGAAGAAIQGGNVGIGALIGGIVGGIAGYLDPVPVGKVITMEDGSVWTHTSPGTWTSSSGEVFNVDLNVSISAQVTPATGSGLSPEGASGLAGAALGAIRYSGQQAGDAGARRLAEAAEVMKLDPYDNAGREAIKRNYRAGDPITYRNLVKSLRPGLGPRPGSVGHANKPNAKWTAAGRVLKTVGRVAVFGSLVVDVASVAVAENTGEALFKMGFSILGSLAGGTLGALAGGGVASLFTGAAGAAAGGLAGEALGAALYRRYEKLFE